MMNERLSSWRVAQHEREVELGLPFALVLANGLEDNLILGIITMYS